MGNLAYAQGSRLPFDGVEKRLRLNEKSPFYVNYLNGHILIKKIQQDLKSSDEYKEKFDKYFAFMSELEVTKLWLNSDEQIITMNLLDIYQSFLRYLKDKTFEDQLFNTAELSMYGPLGPFQTMAPANLVNNTLAKKIILYNLIKNKIPVRKFRLEVDSTIIWQFGDNYKQVEKLKIKQITEHGIVFSTKDEGLLQDLSETDKIRIYMNLNCLKGGQFDSNIFYSDHKNDIFEIDQDKVTRCLSFNSFLSDEIHFFCRFKNFDKYPELSILQNFVSESEEKLSQIIF